MSDGGRILPLHALPALRAIDGRGRGGFNDSRAVRSPKPV